MNYLARLAELAETAHARHGTAQVSVASVASEKPETHSRLTAVSNVLLLSGRRVAAHLGEGKRRYWTVAATLALLLISVAAWKTWHKPASAAATGGQITQSEATPALTSASGVGADLTWKPSPARPLNSNHSGATPEVQQSAKAEVPDALSEAETSPVSSTKIRDLTAADTIKRAITTDSDSDTTEAPQLSASNLDNRKIGTLLSVPISLPKFGPPISQGVTAGVLEHQVAPIYPRQALPLRIEGPVVLDATVNENGLLEDVKLVSGHALLAQAAIDAVRQWRYRPYLLNGKPVRMQTKITVNFKMPGR
jgi:TonB family protein